MSRMNSNMLTTTNGGSADASLNAEGTRHAPLEEKVWTGVKMQKEGNTDNDEPFVPWVEDEWTEDDLRDAQDALESSEERCNIPENKLGKHEFLSRTKWDVFYKQNQANFFKDRHYTIKVFPELLDLLNVQNTNQRKTATREDGRPTVVISEVGCGVGNAIFPLLEHVLRQIDNINANDIEDGEQKITSKEDGDHNDDLTLITSRPQHEIPLFHFVVSDFSKNAIDLLQVDERYLASNNNNAHNEGMVSIGSEVWDISCPKPITTTDGVQVEERRLDIVLKQPVRNAVPWPSPAITQCGADATLVMFCLSAIHPDKMATAAKNIANTLRAPRNDESGDNQTDGSGNANGGMVLFRDYGRYDEAQMKIGRGSSKRLAENFYLKHNGTKCYYFTLEDAHRLFVDEAKLEVVDLHYIRRKYFNRSDNTVRRRVWVQGRFRRIRQEDV
jgi:hypothetical protein